jgi:glycosyltransferase involved in cell wall biosynthesis
MSHVLIEAMQLDTPCVATNVGGNPEVITDGVDGLLVPPGDAGALAASIHTLRDDPIQRRALAEAALKSVERFSWQALVDQTEAALLEAARG